LSGGKSPLIVPHTVSTLVRSYACRSQFASCANLVPWLIGAKRRSVFPEPHGGFAGNAKLPLYSGNGFRIFPKRIEDGEVVGNVKDAGGSHEKDFLDAVKSRAQPNADIEVGRLSTTICHLGTISHHLGRIVVFDPSTESFGGDKAANAYLTKEYRRSYELPRV